MDVTRRIRYRGPAARAFALTQMLREEGVEVEWTPPEERRDVASTVAVAVVSQILAAGAYDAIKAAVSRFRARFPKAEVVIEEDEAGED